jgi:membrane peptidoglycan carboxypeptidase
MPMLNRLHWPIMGLLLSLVITFSIGLGVLSVILYQVFWGEDNNLKKSVIMAKINEESVIYFQDEITPIGSFFENAHRRYVPIDEIPEVMLQALVAGEDKNFYDHKGIDPMAIFRAFVEGVKLGRFRQGGSTLTQQTVKNIINRWDPTFQRKFKEWIAAIQLERMYSKREILEFYLNQFHVAQNGNGIGIDMDY